MSRSRTLYAIYLIELGNLLGDKDIRMKKILFLLLICFLDGCVSLSDLPQSLDGDKNNYKMIDDSKIAIVLLYKDQELCAEPEQIEYLKNVISSYYYINENQKIKLKIRAISTNNETLRVLNLAATVLTYSIIPLYDSVKYEVEVELISEKSATLIRGSFTDEGLISILALPFVFKRNFYAVKKMKIEQTIYKMSNTAGEIFPVGSQIEFKSSPVCTNSIHDYFYWQKWK